MMVGLLAYSNSFSVPFVYDDLGAIVYSDPFGQFDWLSWRSYSGLRSLPEATLALNYRISGLNVWSYHVLNLALHIADGWLVWWVVTLLTPPSPPPPAGGSRGALRRAAYGSSWLIALFAALIFVAHPIATEAVTYISQRAVLVTTFFYLVAVATYLKFRLYHQPHSAKASRGRPPAVVWAALSLIATLAAMHSKQIAITIPLMLVWVEVCFGQRPPQHQPSLKLRLASQISLYLRNLACPAKPAGRSWVFSRPLFRLLPWLILLAYIPWRMFGGLPIAQVAEEVVTTGGVTIFEETAPEAPAAPVLSPANYLLTQSGVWLHYLQLYIFPVGQSIDHDFTVMDSPYTLRVLAGFLVTVGMVFLAWLSWPKHRLVTFGFGWFGLTMLLESSVFPLREVIAEYRLYLPSVGLAMVMGGGMGLLNPPPHKASAGKALKSFLAKYFDLLPEWLNSSPALPREALKERSGDKGSPPAGGGGVWQSWPVGVAAVIILTLSIFTWQRNSVWQDAATLWQDAINKASTKARPYNNLGTILLERGEATAAAEKFSRATELDARYAAAYHNLGTAQAKLGLLPEAIDAYQQALALDPSSATTLVNLGTMYLVQENLPEAERVLRVAIARDARSPRAHTVLGAVSLKQGRFQEAREQFEAALAIDPSYASALNNLELLEKLAR